MESKTIMRFSREGASRRLVAETNYESLNSNQDQERALEDFNSAMTYKHVHGDVELNSLLLSPQKYFEFK
jgi:hypothetical protein